MVAVGWDARGATDARACERDPRCSLPQADFRLNRLVMKYTFVE